MRDVSGIVLVTILLASLVGSAGAHPIQWTVAEGGNGHYYEVVEYQYGMTWDDAADVVSGTAWSGGYLATLTSAEENIWVWEQLGHPHEHWLGGFQPPGSPEPGGGWTWVSGEPWVFEYWYDGEPNNNAPGGESALKFNAQGGWNDVSASYLIAGYIAEYDILEPRQPTQWPVADGGNDHFYLALDTPEGCTWSRAVEIADASFWNGMQGHLATITSTSENSWIWSSFGEPAGHRLGGFQPEGSPEPSGGWSWRSGEEWVFDCWHDGEPNDNAPGGESTLIFSGIGEWNDISASTPCNGYVLEFEPTASSVRQASWTTIKAMFRTVE